MKIVTDSAADMSPAEADSLGVTVAPLHIIFPEGEVAANEITPDDFYQRLEAMQPNTPSTAQPSVGDFVKIYQKLAAAGEEILSIHISSGLSGTVNSARLAAEQVAEKLITVVDTKTLSGGQRFEVLAAAKLAKAGWEKAAILERLAQIREVTEVVYTLDTLSYLARGGRIGRVQALASSLLNIKPIIRVDRSDGKYSTVSKMRTIKKAVYQLVDHLDGTYEKNMPLWISAVHGRFEGPHQLLCDLLQERLNVARLETLRISPVLGVHTGPGLVGAIAVPMKLMEGVA